MTVELSADAIRFPDGTLIFNRAWVLGDGGAVAEEAVAVDSSPSLTLAMNADRDPVGAGELLTYTLTFGNASMTTLNGVTLTAQLPVGTELQSTSDQGMLNGRSLTWELDKVFAGQSGRREFTVEAPAEATDGDVLESTAEIRDASAAAVARATSATTVRTNAPTVLAMRAFPARRGAAACSATS